MQQSYSQFKIWNLSHKLCKTDPGSEMNSKLLVFNVVRQGAIIPNNTTSLEHY